MDKTKFWGLIEIGEKFHVKPGDYLVVQDGIAIDVIPKKEYNQRKKRIEEISKMLDKIVEKIKET